MLKLSYPPRICCLKKFVVIFRLHVSIVCRFMVRRRVPVFGVITCVIFYLANAARFYTAVDEGSEKKGLRLPAFSARINLPATGYIWANSSTAVLHRDPAKMQFRFTIDVRSDLLDSDNQWDLNIQDSTINWTIGNLHGTSYCTIPHVLSMVRPWIDDYHFEDPFAFLKYARKTNETDVVNGEECVVWSSKGIQDVWPSDSGHVFFSGDACVAADGVPRRVRSNEATSMLSMWWPDFTAEMILHDVKIGTPHPAVFTPAASCGIPVPPCRQPGHGMETLTMYRGLSMSEFRAVQGRPPLTDRNAGDLLGSTFYVAQDVDLVAMFLVTLNATFGQWGFCDFVAWKNKCDGDQHHVGRGAPEGFFARAAQCGDNKRLGSWFSLPGASECAEDQEVGTYGCTWKARFVRAVTGKCLRDERGLSSTIESEFGHPPFKKSAVILQSALASPDPLRGGCPDAAVASSEPTPTVASRRRGTKVAKAKASATGGHSSQITSPGLASRHSSSSAAFTKTAPIQSSAAVLSKKQTTKKALKPADKQASKQVDEKDPNDQPKKKKEKTAASEAMCCKCKKPGTKTHKVYTCSTSGKCSKCKSFVGVKKVTRISAANVEQCANDLKGKHNACRMAFKNRRSGIARAPK